MPANLPPQYVVLEKEYRQEKDPAIKLELLERMLSEIPKHKGTDHLQGEIKQKIARLKKQQKQKISGAKRRESPDHVPKEGIAQYALVGPPNSGKSSLLAAMTNATPEIADFAFTTRKPMPGMTDFEGVQLQMVDLPPICTQFCENWVPNVVRNADVVLAVLSVGEDDLLDAFVDSTERLEQNKIKLINDPPPMDQPAGVANKRTIVVANQIDRPDSEDRLEILRDFFAIRYPIIAISAKNGTNLDELKRLLRDSFPATLGIGERTVNVRFKNLQRKRKLLEDKGFHAIGHGFNGDKKVPLWFIRRGSL